MIFFPDCSFRLCLPWYHGAREGDLLAVEMDRGSGLASVGREAVARGRNFDGLTVSLSLV